MSGKCTSSKMSVSESRPGSDFQVLSFTTLQLVLSKVSAFRLKLLSYWLSELLRGLWEGHLVPQLPAKSLRSTGSGSVSHTLSMDWQLCCPVRMLKTEKRKAPGWPHSTRQQSRQDQGKAVSEPEPLLENETQGCGHVTLPNRNQQISDVPGTVSY